MTEDALDMLQNHETTDETTAKNWYMLECFN